MLLLIFKLLLVVCCVNSYDIGLCKEYYNKGSDRGDIFLFPFRLTI
uniref:Uncharacterized protein n=1 Tax=Megaselia scalaris TaxID=36166 RepID=T1GU05_MEGSC